ncbi:RNA methyltransferase [Falsarthrobacter nasiphocae]|uniref:tRNA G18 (Ribose-2'-O)-methylase SpoU n=1 Tax=Falsarthrobacter nasiphocae TaxID=189863 RepID=A0AAE4C647_9MICC|nr:RNA methyltransferase [Falsarthrobacter nasiphocae]MDR6891129.1 tRNA G18 (ribose-2'-O)-methylase SpoU [Falsarthrobacter nasiphocae]
MNIVRLTPELDAAGIGRAVSAGRPVCSTESMLADYVGLTDAALRQRQDVEQGRFIAETTLVVKRALEAGYAPRSFFLAEKHLPDLAEEIAAFPDVPVFVGDESTLARIAGFHLHRGALASMWRRPLPPLAELVAGARRIAVIEDVVDHTNIGALMRSAAALGVEGVVLSPRCADPLYRRAIRTSMGTVFSLPFTRAESWPGALGELRAAGFSVAALALADDAVPLDAFAAQLPADARLAVLLGSEGPGLTRAALEASDARVIIPMSAGTDSLNVAAAAAVAFWETRAR